jgi:hypothetical protein
MTNLVIDFFDLTWQQFDKDRDPEQQKMMITNEYIEGENWNVNPEANKDDE